MALTPTMGLDLPIPLVTTGPTFAQMLVTAFEVVDEHDHTDGNGALITPAAMNINSSLDFQGTFQNNVAGVRMTDQTVTPTDPLDVRMLYSKNGELAYLDAAGNEVVITSAGSVAGAAGTISGLSSPASASYSAVTKTFSVFQDTNKFSKLSISNIAFYEFDVASPNPITIASPASVGSAYTMTLPAIQATDAVEFLTTDTTGALDHATLAGTANQVTVVQSKTAVTLSLPQNIHTGATPTFASMTATNSVSAGTVFLAGNGSAGNVSYGFTSDPDTGMYRSAANSLMFVCGGSPIMLVDNSTGVTLQSSFPLTVPGLLTASARINCAGGSESAPGLYFASDADTGVYRVGTNTLGLTAGGVQGLQMSASAMAILQPTQFSSSVEVASGGAFKVKLYSGSLSNNATVELGDDVSGSPYGYFGVYGVPLDSTYPIQPISAAGRAYFREPAASGMFRITNNGVGSTITYRVTLIYQ